MIIDMIRIKSDAESTLGTMTAPGLSLFTCEDAYRAEKVYSETRIPAGRYKLALKPRGSSRFDTRYVARFGESFHKGMVELQDVPGFTGILIHVGNSEKDTSGCILVGLGRGQDKNGHYSVTQSTAAYQKLYPLLRDALLRGEDCTIVIRDRDRGA